MTEDRSASTPGKSAATLSHASLAGTQVALALSPQISRPAAGIGADLAARGCKLITLRDGDPAGLEAGLLVLVGDCRLFPRYAGLLRRRGGDRPRVVAWQVDPLPPRTLDPALEKQALRWIGETAHRPWLRAIGEIANASTYRAIVERGIGDFSNRIANHAVPPRMVRVAIESYAFIRQGVAEKWIDGVLASTVGKQRFLADRGIATGFAPIGFHRAVGEDRAVERDVDVLFLGRVNDRRNERLDALVPALEKKGVKVVVVGTGLFGEARTAMLNRVRIVIHLHRCPWDTPWMRFVLAAGNGALVVSEPLADPEPFAAGVNYVEAPYEQLPDAIAALCSDPDRLTRLAKAGGEFVRERLALRRSVDTLIAAGLACPSAVNGVRVPTPPARGLPTESASAAPRRGQCPAERRGSP